MGISQSKAKRNAKKANAAAASAPAGQGSGAPALLNLDATLQDHEASSAFMVFAKADMSEENLEFWLKVAEFRVAWDADEDAERRKQAASAILDEYLKDGAPKQVCIGDWRVKRCLLYTSPSPRDS